MAGKRVWHLVSNRWFSAITAYAIQHAKALQEVGYDNHVTFLQGSPGYEVAKEASIAVSGVRSFGVMGVAELWRFYQAFKADVIIVYGGPETQIARLFRKACVIRFRGADEERYGAFFSWVEGSLAGYIVPAQFRAHTLRSHTKKPIAIIPYGDSLPFHPQKTSRPLVLSLGRLDPIKGHKSLFVWFKGVLDHWPSSEPRPQLKIVGEAKNLSARDLMTYAYELGMAGEDLIFVDQRLPREELFSDVSLGVISSLGSEVICRVGVEFLLSGVPVAVTGVGGLPELIRHPKDGFLYPMESFEGSVKRLVNFFKEDLQAKDERRQRALACYSLAVMAQKSQEFLNQV